MAFLLPGARPAGRRQDEAAALAGCRTLPRSGTHLPERDITLAQHLAPSCSAQHRRDTTVPAPAENRPPPHGNYRGGSRDTKCQLKTRVLEDTELVTSEYWEEK